MELDEFSKHYREEQAKIVSDLEEIGVQITDIYQELPTNKANWKKATPILIEWLPQVKNSGLREAVIRLLSVPWLRGNPVGGTLMKMALNPTLSSDLRWVIGNTMEVIADDKSFSDIKKLVTDRSFGISRQMFVMALGRMKTPEAIPLLVDLLDDDDVNGHAIVALRKLKAIETVEDIRKLVNYPRTWVRNEAKKTVAKFEKL